MSIYDFSYTSISGGVVKLSEYAGKALLILNTASKCGFTPQYEGLEQLYKTYGERGLVVIGFPCNQFGKQEPGGDDQISEFCKVRYGVTFPLSTKIDVNGENAHPLFKWLKAQKPFEGFGKGAKAKMMSVLTKAKIGDSDIKWNFTKFLIDRDGGVSGRYEPTVEPQSLINEIERLLGGAK
ncbi:MAG: glutathione peroxidase [Clostridiales bacterium]|jgi:glutathione peroxidase|nr:glutathione peroxidase [Clostridiales bacterium]